MARLANSRTEGEGSHPDIFITKTDQLCGRLEVVGEVVVSKHRKLDIIMAGMSLEYTT